MPLGAGTLILVSDPSILLNSMLVKDDNLLFIQSLTGSDINNGKILVDVSHLVQDPLEITKTKLFGIKGVLSQPYVLSGIVSLLFIFASIYILKMGGSIGRES